MDTFEVLDALPSPARKHSPNWGGSRKGSGRKGADYVKPEEVEDYDKARARKEMANAGLAELDLQVKSGMYVARESVRQASATALSSVSQSLRSIPDNIERKLGVSAEVAEEVGRQIDAVLNDLADEFELMTGPE